MLQAIREKAQGWIAWAIVILISVPFALWGIQEYLGVGSEPEVAVVEGEKITQRMLDQRTRDFRENMRLSLGDAYRADFFEDSTLKKQVLDGMVEQAVLAKNAADWNLRTSDMQARGFISSIPAFQRDGRFDQLSYETAVRNRGTSRAGFEQDVRQDLLLGQLRSGVRDSAFVTETELATRVRLNNEKRKLIYARVAADKFLDQIEFSEDDLKSYYEANLDRYRTPERVKLSYVLLDAATLASLIDVNEEALEQYFEDHRTEFVAPEERAMRHILISVSPNATEEEVQAARNKADDLLMQVREGGDFASLAKENSDDPGSAGSGGDLGWVERGLMVPPFEQAAFELNKDEVSELVRTDFGFHIIQVTDIRGGSDAGFADLREKVESAFRKFEAENLYFDYAERLANSAYESPDSLTPASEALGLKVQTTDWITRDAVLPGALGSPRVVNAAFADDVLVEGHNSELIEVGQQQALVVRVAEHEPAGVKPFADNLDLLGKDYKVDKASEAAAAAGAKAIAELDAGGESLEQLASDKAWVLEQPGEVGREQPTVPAEVLAKAFGLKPPEQGATAYAGVVSAEGDYMVIAVSGVQGGELAALSDAERQEAVQQATNVAASAQLRYFTRSLRDRAKIELKPIE
ncbi:MAG: SurA N-terminal domain-containing protein [Gammaproteobacteria bacterium]|jgi:peptidyl-prolyl cis-trans isomerase D|nr:SurA N-terminal domain-containing protein [Gammaproteobacteria bacterium]